MTFEEWCDVNYPRVERLERTLMGIAWEAALSAQPEEGVSHLDQEPLDFAAALTLLREAREEIKRLRAQPEAGLTMWLIKFDGIPQAGPSRRSLSATCRRSRTAPSGRLGAQQLSSWLNWRRGCEDVSRPTPTVTTT